MKILIKDITADIQQLPLEQQLKGIRDAVYLHAKKVGGPFEVKNILISRFTLPQEAFDKGYISCGTLVNITANILKQLGYEVKLIHGNIPQTPTHAWISIKNKENNQWEQYDVTRKDFRITTNHHEEYSVNDWSEIKDILEAIYNKNHTVTDL